MADILIIKTGALGDVLRTTALLPGLRARYPDARIVWLTAKGALDLVQHHPLVDQAHALRVVKDGDEERVEFVDGGIRGGPFVKVISLDDELALCGLAGYIGRPAEQPGVLSGAYLNADGERAYTDDVAEWFGMGLLSRHGKEEADRRKIANTESHPAIHARMLGIDVGEPELPLPEASLGFAETFFREHGLAGDTGGPVIGLNTGAGGRWESKKLPVERVVALAEALFASQPDGVRFLVLGGPDESERNARIASGIRALRPGAVAVDAGGDNSLLDFAALIDRVDLLFTSDSLALHMGVARNREVVAFFAPTSAAEIELYGRGEKVASTAPDACSYRRDADTSTLTVERLHDAVVRRLEAR